MKKASTVDHALERPGTVLRSHCAEGVASIAVYDSTEVYRYFLRRIWDQSAEVVAFIGLNPSTATELQNDPTVNRCQNFARLWGYGGFVMLNAFGLRSTDPRGLKQIHDPIGPLNDAYIELGANSAARVICCWGTHAQLQNRQQQLLSLLATHALECFRLTKAGYPNHPLYLRNDSQPIPFDVV